jgi:phosphoglycerate kinase
MALKYVNEIDFKGKRVIARFDFNVPLDKKDPSHINDTTRIDEALETIRYILENGANKLILMSHLGRPDGKPNPAFSLEPVATYLASQLGQEVILTETSTDGGIKTLLNLPETKVVLLQNLRFHAEEENNDRDFAKKLASFADIYINDAFGTAHRKHASTYEINAFFRNRAAGGFLLKKEIKALERVVESPTAPFVAIIGGAKVSDKIKIIERLLPNVTSLIIGGAMAYPFLKAKGYTVGKSLCSDEDVALAKKILNSNGKTKVILPVDHITSETFGGTPKVVSHTDIPDTDMALDIGPATIELYRQQLLTAKTVLWNGPMGYFENADFAKGTFAIAESLAALKDKGAFTLVGGGDSVSAVKQAGLAEQMSHVSTGGGASLEFIEQGTLPGIQALKFGIS